MLQGATVHDIVLGANEGPRFLLVELQYGLTQEAALQSPPIFVTAKRLGKGNMLKLMAFLIKSFQDSLKVKEKMSSIDVIEAAEVILETYTHDSVKDIILAFKDAKKSGRNFYNSLSSSDLFDVLNDHFEKKAAYLENRHKDQKMQAESNSMPFLEGLAKHCPKQLEQMANMIHPGHINKEHLRLKLTIQKQREKRGLNGPQQQAPE